MSAITGECPMDLLVISFDSALLVEVGRLVEIPVGISSEVD